MRVRFAIKRINWTSRFSLSAMTSTRLTFRSVRRVPIQQQSSPPDPADSAPSDKNVVLEFDWLELPCPGC
jgi:hypothetical protein